MFREEWEGYGYLINQIKKFIEGEGIDVVLCIIYMVIENGQRGLSYHYAKSKSWSVVTSRSPWDVP